MKNLSFLIVFGLIVSLAQTAQAQTPHIVLPDGMTGGCLSRFNQLYADGELTVDEATDLTASCMDADIGSMSFWEHLYDEFNGEGGRPTFHNMGEVMAAFTTCHFEEVCPHDPPAPGTTPTPTTHARRTLVVECRGACVHDPARGIDHGLTGRGWRRHVVCEEGAVPLAVEWRHSTVDGESLRHVGDGVGLFITYCYDPAVTHAPEVIQRIVNETDLTDVWNHIHRLEHACGPEGMRGHSADWDLMCTRFDEVVINATNIRSLRADLDALNADLNALREREDRRWARACHRSDAEWDAMTEDQRLAIIGTPECDAVGSGGNTTIVGGWHLRFHLGAGFYLPIIAGPRFVLASPNGIVYGELEALPDPHAGFFLRGFIGAGDLMDRVGQFNPNGTIGMEGVAGGSAGAVIRFDEHFALDLGLASSFGFNPGGQIGSTLHAWPWFQIGGEVRLRWNPIPLVHVELTGGLADTHSEVLFQGADRMIGTDAVGGNVTLGVGVSF